MDSLKLCDSDYRFMLIVWANAPINSGRLVELCYEKLGWKKSTTYTTIKKLSEKGFVINEQAVVSVRISKEQVQSQESGNFVERTFEGSLPQFLSAFFSGRKISEGEAEEIKHMIEVHKEDNSSFESKEDNSSFESKEDNSSFESKEE
jgi:BlaI family transcriptional regulator, penicillinase repressor